MSSFSESKIRVKPLARPGLGEPLRLLRPLSEQYLDQKGIEFSVAVQLALNYVMPTVFVHV